jgi:hypothetical protein
VCSELQTVHPTPEALRTDADVNGHIVFVARGLMALASTAAAIAGPGVAAEPTTYAVASGTAAVAAWIMVGVRGS